MKRVSREKTFCLPGRFRRPSSKANLMACTGCRCRYVIGGQNIAGKDQIALERSKAQTFRSPRVAAYSVNTPTLAPVSQNTEPGTIVSIHSREPGSLVMIARPSVAGAAVIQKPYFAVRCVDDGRFAEETID